MTIRPQAARAGCPAHVRQALRRALLDDAQVGLLAGRSPATIKRGAGKGKPRRACV